MFFYHKFKHVCSTFFRKMFSSDSDAPALVLAFVLLKGPLLKWKVPLVSFEFNQALSSSYTNKSTKLKPFFLHGGFRLINVVTVTNRELVFIGYSHLINKTQLKKNCKIKNLGSFFDDKACFGLP